jgi:hypothetical protein
MKRIELRCTPTDVEAEKVRAASADLGDRLGHCVLPLTATEELRETLQKLGDLAPDYLADQGGTP